MSNKQNIYDRIPTLPTAELIKLRRLWSRLVDSRPTPRRHDFWGKCVTRATLVLEQRQALPHRSKENIGGTFGTTTN